MRPEHLVASHATRGGLMSEALNFAVQHALEIGLYASGVTLALLCLAAGLSGLLAGRRHADGHAHA
jgi:hypothetical protein